MAGLITRFAPSPTGRLHLGHAFCALTASDLARQSDGVFLLRMENIDTARASPAFEAMIEDDLRWLGLTWPVPVMRQSERGAAYDSALTRLDAMGVTYRCTCTRGDIRAALAAPQEGVFVTGPDGPVYPGTCRDARHRAPDAAIRLDMRRAVALTGPVEFTENGPLHPGTHRFDPDWLVAQIGDFVLARRDIGTAYHLAVCVDDAEQGITLVTRGADLFDATAIHAVLQRLLALPQPMYHHHRLIRDETGKRLAKRDDARSIAACRAAGATPADIRATLGLQTSGAISSTSSPPCTAV